MKNCDLCNRATIESGKDSLLYNDKNFHIIDNGNTHLREGNIIKFAKRRITLILNKHQGHLTISEMSLAKSKLTKVLKKLGYNPNEYFFKATMGTYPNHFHIHAYIPPFSDEGKILE